ncbi:decapping and exoribonuclease protein-like isoform X2 [Babylonia areolata]|uniref:decapping and exoribonuclease protein-like isoform X2 n=1 Tax=Babylonia areolata TaxID=304850 RepID=UPI003FD65519
MKRQHVQSNPDDRIGGEAKVKSARLEDKPAPRHGATFRLSVDTNKYDRRFPHFRKPMEVGSFSQDAVRAFHHDRRQLRFYVKPAQADPGFDLRRGYATMVRKDETVKEYLDDLLRWVMRNRTKFSLKLNKEQASGISGDAVTTIDSLNTDFVCWRGLLTKLLCTPYERQDDWKIAITKYRGTYFLCEFETERKRRQEAQMTPRQKEMSYWGWKFEQYVSAEQEGGKPDTDRAVNNNEGFCSVVRSRLHSHSLVYGGEVDAWDSSMEGDNKYVELKTTREMHTSRQWHNFKRFKLLKWWAQSFLLGIRKIVSGFRDDEGVVHGLQDFLTQDIPSFTQDVHNGWQPHVCFNFLDQVLSFIKRSVSVDDPRCT